MTNTTPTITVGPMLGMSECSVTMMRRMVMLTTTPATSRTSNAPGVRMRRMSSRPASGSQIVANGGTSA
jgi:hypothetical protein